MTKLLKYSLMMGFILFMELLITYGFYQFLSASKTVFVLFAILLLFATLFYVFFSRYREAVKIKPKKEVLQTYRRIMLQTFLVVGMIAGVLIFIRAIIYIVS